MDSWISPSSSRLVRSPRSRLSSSRKSCCIGTPLTDRNFGFRQSTQDDPLIQVVRVCRGGHGRLCTLAPNNGTNNGTNNGEQTTGNKQRGTNNGEQTTGNKQRGTNNGEQTTGNKQRGNKQREQTTGNKQRGTNNGEQTTGTQHFVDRPIWFCTFCRLIEVVCCWRWGDSWLDWLVLRCLRRTKLRLCMS